MTATRHRPGARPGTLGGGAARRNGQVGHEPSPWEKRCHALAVVLDSHEIISAEEKRRCSESLGNEMIARLSYYEHWILALAIVLFEKRILAPSELAWKMDEIAERWPGGGSGG
ncbi:Nitrile hydratase beta subunit [Tistlia consotensis]|uniref:Nitrile hydratase beta subunit n=1 Tax=Tistlia consotensis USBA 355 TaxID=560819 RepID=A0A1Y6CL99_9PROT|nr:SH3-like domain-containing protein [Tistlia consotensis]SMF73336.1 Nitrile hydratase beta subunit [Tistlia consotensis USBA 355]SNS30639.1 Nitrile hydratase beta subunit [Tistlia consotensis]